MKQVHLVAVDTKALVPGMYIAELDRPWIDSPFLLEGFVLEEQEDLERLRDLCHHVYVDTERSDPASVRLLLEQTGPTPAATSALRRPRAARATASLVDALATGASRPTAPPGATVGLMDHLTRIIGETLAGGGADKADQRPTISSADTPGTAPDALRTAGAWRDRGGVRQPAAAGTGGTGTGTAYVATAETPASTRPHHRRYRRPRSGLLVGLDGEADRADLSGQVLIAARERSLAGAPDVKRANEVIDRIQDVVPTLFQNLQDGREFDLQEANSLLTEIADCINRSPEALKLLSNMRRVDDYALKHAQDCTLRLMTFARDQGLSRDNMQLMGLVGLLLDVGKLHPAIVDRRILNKPGPLLPDEYDLIRTHVEHSVGMLDKTSGIDRAVKEVIAWHHECVDGSGYPYGLVGNEIDLRARMARIVDAYSAMLSERPYRRAMTTSEAFSELRRGKGTQFDEQLVEDFFQTIGTYGVGTVLEMNTGEVGIVVRVHRSQRLLPELMLVLDHEKKPFAYPVVLDLRNEPDAPDGSRYSIRQELPDGSVYLDPDEFFFAAAH